MAKKSKLFKDFKTVKKTAGKTALHAVESGVTFVAVKGITNMISAKITNPNMQKAVGPITAVAGIALEAFSENHHLAAVGRGMAIQGMDRSAETFIPPAMKEKIGLAGVGQSNANANAGKNQQYYDELRRKVAEAMNRMNEAGAGAPADQEPVAGIPEQDLIMNLM